MHRLHCLIVAVLLGFVPVVAVAQASNVSTQDYERAERFLFRNFERYIINGDVRHAWLGDSDELYYRRQTRTGQEFVRVNARDGRREPAFDHAMLASALAAATNTKIDPSNLPFDWLEFVDERRAVQFSISGDEWRCKIGGSCSRVTPDGSPEEATSPDGKWAVVRKGHDVWLRSRADGSERRLTDDGEERFAYGGQDGLTQFRRRIPARAVALWSPDSRYVLVERVDDRGVADMYILQQVPEDGTVRPRLYKEPVAFPGEPNKNHVESMAIFDVTDGTRADVRHPSFLNGISSILLEGDAFWAADGRTVYVMPNEDGRKTKRMLAVDPATGRVKQLIEETAATYLDRGATMWGSRTPEILRSGEFIWYSERDGWGHLYLYDREGRLKSQITSGKWRVRDVVRVDERLRLVYFTANGREHGEDPYQRHLYVSHFDGSGLRLLTPENADHDVDLDEGFSQSGRYFVDIYSRPDLVPVTVLRSRDGREVMKLESADISPLLEQGYTMPEPFQVLAADGSTPIYGTVFRPGRFDPSRQYPVVDVIYPGPQRIQTAKSFMRGLVTHAISELGFAQSLAELGFIVVTLDGRGTPLRSKAFHDVSFGNMQQAGNLEDHVAGIRQLAQRYPYMDLDRVGIYGHSAGGFATVRAMLDHPEFFKVGISSAGDHDPRGDDLGWATTYQGPYTEESWAPLINARLVERLRGKLLLIQGDMDQAVHSAITFQLMDALVKANKDFDLLIVPNGGHDVDRHAYVIRRRWDYFLRNLRGAEPPGDYRIAQPPGTLDD